MAIYFNLCVDCGSDKEVAGVIEERFATYELPFEDLEPVTFRCFTSEQRGRWYVGVQPVGMSYGSPDGDRPEIRDDGIREIVGEALLGVLREVSGFRRAFFGGEVIELLSLDEEMDYDIEYAGMVFSTAEFGDDPAGVTTEAFSEGYQRVVESGL